MKKIFIATILAMAAFSLFAAAQYDIESSGIKINEDMSMVIHVTDNSFFKTYDTFAVTIKAADGTITTKTFNTADASGKHFDLGDVDAGSVVTFAAGQSNSTYEQLSLAPKNASLTYLVVDNNGKTTTFKIQIQGGESSKPIGPAGQPLPGVFAALLLGGGAAGAAVFKRRRKAAAAKQE